ncbi:MAG: PTS system mannose/fructose/sorbose family transporter subunit IID [Deltaproteobacteria bacterium]|jgi:hypothetical protein|nr:PTS system mannose/fructose/sorbose family transporter subunit IID [Deltaproteobacteria bacterium]
MPEERPSPAGSRLEAVAASLRSLFLESSWNCDGQQNLGRAWVVGAGLRDLPEGAGPPPSRLLAPFNTNPVSCGLVLGASLSLEREAAEGFGVPPAEREEIVASLASMAGAVGDQVFWNTWLPFCSLAGFLAVWASGSWAAALLLPVLFNLLAAPARVLCFWQGLSRGREVCVHKATPNLLSLRRKLHSATLFLAGAGTVLALEGAHGFRAAGGPEEVDDPGIWLFAAAALALLSGGAAVLRRAPRLRLPVYLIQLGGIYLFFLLAGREAS